jgi:hypothetical protein
MVPPIWPKMLRPPVLKAGPQFKLFHNLPCFSHPARHIHDVTYAADFGSILTPSEVLSLGLVNELYLSEHYCQQLPRITIRFGWEASRTLAASRGYFQASRLKRALRQSVKKGPERGPRLKAIRLMN